MPTSVSAGIGAVGALAGGIGSLFGGSKGGGQDMADAYVRAAHIQAQAAADARAQQRDMYERAAERVAPWNKAGAVALGRLESIYGLPGSEHIDLTETLRATPGYEWLQGQGTEALQRYGTARGMRNSGAALRGATDYGQNLALTKAWTPYIAGVTGLSNAGLEAGRTMGGWGMTTGGQQAGLTMAGGQALAAGGVNAANAMAAEPSDVSSFMRSLGLVGGLAPQLGRGFNALDGWWNSGGGVGGGGGGEGAINPYAYTSTPALYNAQWNSSMGAPSLSMYADGGPVPNDGRPIVVGERGPEVFVPNEAGFVVPNHALPASVRAVGTEFSPGSGLVSVAEMVAELRSMF